MYQPLWSPASAKWKSRVTAAWAGSSGVIVLNRSGIRLESSVFEPTVNFITVAVDPSPNPLASTTSVPAG